VLPGTTQAHKNPEENSAPAGLSPLGEALSGLGRRHLPSRGGTGGRRGTARAGEDGEYGRGPRVGEDDGEGGGGGTATMEKGGAQLD